MRVRNTPSECVLDHAMNIDENVVGSALLTRREYFSCNSSVANKFSVYAVEFYMLENDP